MVEHILLRDLPESVLDEAIQVLAPYVVGFVDYTQNADGEDVQLLGSGTLVSVGSTKAILTAHHVVTILPREGRLGLVIAAAPQQYTVDTRGLTYLRIARGSNDADGPDLGAVILSPAIAGPIAASKTFYDLDSRRELMLNSPPEVEAGMWFVNGFVDEYTWEETGAGRTKRIKGFYNLSGAGGPDNEVRVGDYDYFDFPVSVGSRAIAPRSFGGMSGGGLWQFTLVKDGDLIRPVKPLLSGVVFYQYETTENQCGVKCHGRRSVYQVVHNAIRDFAATTTR